MGLFSNIARNIGDWFRKRRVSVTDQETQRELWYIHLSPNGMVSLAIATLCLMFALTLALVAYTPILDFLPGYRTDAIRSRETLMRNLIRIDSLEQRMNDILTYNENIILVVDGKTPVQRSTQNDTLHIDKSIVPPSGVDSVLRRQMEQNTRYAMNTSSAASQTARRINAIAPVSGIITERFNAKAGLYGVRMAAAPSSQVVAIADGVIISVDWSPEAGNMVVLQHADNMLSVYRQIINPLAVKGQHVAKGEILGYITGGEAGGEMTLLEFELWGNGVPLDPESYILF